MALGDNTSNDIPLGVGYDANGNAKSFVELSAISVTNVSATQYWGLPAGSDGTLSGLSDTRVSSTGDRKPLHGESLVYSAGYWTPCAVIAGGGGGVSFPNGNTGDILYYQSNGTSVTSLSPTATPLNLATTGNLSTKQAETIQYVIDTYVPLDSGEGSTNVSGPLIFVSNSPQFTTGFNATGPLVFTGVASFTERPTIGGTNFAIATDLNTYLPEVGGVDKNSLVITTGASAVSSLSGASGTIPYFEGTTPAPGLKTFAQILTNENYNISPGATYAASPVLSHLTGDPLATVTSMARIVVNDYTLPADTLAANKKVRITYLGRILQNTGGDVNITLHFYLGGTAILNSSGVFGSNATKRGFSIEVNVSRLATDVQLVTQEFKSAAATGGTTGAGTIGTTERSGFSSNGATEDESGTLVASLQVQYSATGEGADQAAFELNDVLVEVI